MEKRKYMIIAVDFDGTLCINEWPGIGNANTHLINTLIRFRSNGDKIILWTCRTGDQLDDAIKWCKGKGLEFDAVNENIPEIVEAFGNEGRKIFADCYIDDRAMECSASDII